MHNLIRGCDPQPGAFATLAGKRLRLYDATVEAQRPASRAGTILSNDAAGLRLALDGATLLVRRVRLEPSPKKVPPAELAAAGALRVGDHLT